MRGGVRPTKLGLLPKQPTQRSTWSDTPPSEGMARFGRALTESQAKAVVSPCDLRFSIGRENILLACC